MMDHYLAFTDGTITVPLSGGDYAMVQSYTPRSPELTTANFDPGVLADGGERSATTRRNVTESARIAIIPLDGGGYEGCQRVLQAIELMLRRAEEWQRRRVGAAVYVEFDPLGRGVVYRSEILSGRVELAEGTTDVRLSQSVLECQVTWTRRWYWEGAEEEVELFNNNGFGLGGVEVDNCEDGTYDNWVEIEAGSITGALPTPPRIEMTNNVNSATVKPRTIMIAHNCFGSPDSLNNHLEGEDASAGVPHADATNANGSYMTLTLGASEALVCNWSLSAAWLALWDGNYARALARFHTLPSASSYLRLKFDRAGAGASNLWTGPLVNLNAKLALQDLGVVQLPPLWTAGSPAALYLELWGYAGSSVDLDYLNLAPLDGWRQITTVWGNSIVFNDRLVDDGIQGVVYSDTPATPANGRRGGFMVTGLPILLWPGKVQRLYFYQRFWTDAGADDEEYAAIDRTLSIRAYYRPRRLSL